MTDPPRLAVMPTITAIFFKESGGFAALRRLTWRVKSL